MKKDRAVMGQDAMPVYGRFGDQLVAEHLPTQVSAIVGPTGDVRNGLQDKWAAYCKDTHIKNQIPTYKDNRFNALFETSAAVVTNHTVHPRLTHITAVKMNEEIFDNAVKAIMLGIKLCCEKQLVDFLLGGVCAVPEPTQHSCTANSGVMNLVCERHFGTLDASQQRRSHAMLH